MNEEMYRSIDQKDYDVKDFYFTHGASQRIARSKVFEQITLAVIFANAVWIGYDADENTEDTIQYAKQQFQIGENFFCFFFTIEWAVRYFSFAEKKHCLVDHWFKFDSLL